MLYVFTGNRTRAVDEMHKLAQALREKRPDASHVIFEAFSVSRLPELCAGQGLFERKLLAVLSESLTESSAREAFFSALPEIAASENIVLVFEPSLSAAETRQAKKHAAKFLSYTANVPSRKPFSPFVLADALGERNSVRLWSLIMEARREEVDEDSMFGILFWQVKSMQLARGAPSAEAAGMKPFPFSKAKRFEARYPGPELRSLSSRLVASYHEARGKDVSKETALERFALSL